MTSNDTYRWHERSKARLTHSEFLLIFPQSWVALDIAIAPCYHASINWMGKETRYMNGINPTDIVRQNRWGAERRLEFIDHRLLWDRTINRVEIINFFGISPQQASADLAKYNEIAPQNFKYDKSAKTYRATEAFSPCFASSDPNKYLSQLADVVAGQMPEETVFLGWRPQCDVVRIGPRTVNVDVLLQVLWAMRDQRDVAIRYQSMRQPTPTVLWISPLAMGFDGFRWHVRSWSPDTKKFRDLVLSRIQAVTNTRGRLAELPLDHDWTTFIDLTLVPRNGLTPGQRAAIEVDYGMQDGKLVVRCRRALANYVVRVMGLNRTSELPVIEQPIEMLMTDELKAVLNAAKKIPETGQNLAQTTEGI